MSKPVAGETIMAGPVPTRFEVTADMVDGAYCVVRQTIKPGELFWPHVHATETQVIVVLKGQLGARVGDREWTSGPGEVVDRPKGVPHTVWNAGTEPVEMLELTSPGGFDEYFAAQGEMSRSGDSSGRPALLQRFGVSAVAGWTEELEARYGVKQP